VDIDKQSGSCEFLSMIVCYSLSEVVALLVGQWYDVLDLVPRHIRRGGRMGILPIVE
jgi:hypothetical protein